MFERMTRTKMYLVGVGAVMVGMVVLALVIVGGSAAVKFALKERPSFKTGQIIEREFTAAHDESYMRQQYMGETCTMIGSTRSCTSNYIWVQDTHHYPDRWDFKIKNCHVKKKDGTFWLDKKTGSPRCFTKWVNVDETDYHAKKVGTRWMG